MAEFYSNLPQKLKDSLQKTANRLIDENYKTKFEFAVKEINRGKVWIACVCNALFGSQR